MQTNWIGRSEGAEIVFDVAPDEQQPGGEEIRVFTTRPDTLFGATFMVLAPEHPLVEQLTHPDRARGGRRVPLRGAPQVGDRPPVDRAREDRRAARRARDQPDQRRADPDLDRRLRAARLRHRRDHGRARPRRARLRVRAADRPADPPGRGAASGEPPAELDIGATSPTPPTRCWSTRASSRGMLAVEGGRRITETLEKQRQGQGGASPIACATGWSAASARGARRSRSSTARRIRRAASCPCPRTSCRCCCPTTSSSGRRAATRWSATRRS